MPFSIPTMRSRDTSAPQLRQGYWAWSFAGASSRIIFVGKGPRQQRRQAFEDVTHRPHLPHTWPHQIHSSSVIETHHEGLCGKADALISAERDLVLSVATADCVPITIEGRKSIATIHAGWRGLVGRIIQKTLDDLNEDPSDLQAWIGPAIGACCYEVGPEVGGEVAAASDPAVLLPRKPKPHLDLTGAAESQLEQGGVQRVHALSVCTRCSPDWLWSYRREGVAAGRNWTFAWRE